MRPFVSTLCLAGLLVSAAHAQNAEVFYERAMARYEIGDFAGAYTEFSAAGDAGHVRSQEIAGLMRLAGPLLYGAAVPRDDDAAMHWMLKAAAAGSEMAQHLTCAHARHIAPDTYAYCEVR
jgi:TPR repeat protein